MKLTLRVVFSQTRNFTAIAFITSKNLTS